MLCFGSPDFVRDPQPENSDSLRDRGRGCRRIKQTLEVVLDTQELFSQTKPKQTHCLHHFLINPYSSSSLTISWKRENVLVVSSAQVQQCRASWWHRMTFGSPSPAHPLIICTPSARIQPTVHATRQRTFPPPATVSSGAALPPSTTRSSGLAIAASRMRRGGVRPRCVAPRRPWVWWNEDFLLCFWSSQFCSPTFTGKMMSLLNQSGP